MSEPAPDKPDRLLHTVPHAAQLLDIGVSTVWKLIAEGKLPTVRIGRSRRIPHGTALATPAKSARLLGRSLPTRCRR
jgi:excisionase family DNA binding protein